MDKQRRRPRADRGLPRLQERDWEGIQFIVEQKGVRRDQMPRYLGRHSKRATKKPGELGTSTAQGIIDRWCALGWVKSVSIYEKESDWLYVTEKGLRVLGSPYTPWTPKRGAPLDHLYWVNEVRLLLEELYQHGRWVSERHLRRTRHMEHYPDAEFFLPNVPKPIAIEVERSLKETTRVKNSILPWLADHYENTWYFVVEPGVLARLQTQRDALPASQRERIFLSCYDESHQRWQTDLGQAFSRNRPAQPDQRPSEAARTHAKQPGDSEVLRAIAGEWVDPPGDQFGTERLPLLTPAWRPQTFEAAVKVAKRLLTPSDEAVLRELRGFQQSKHLQEWHHRLEEQLGLHVGVTSDSGSEYASTANRALWCFCGQRDPEEIVFQLMETVWSRFQDPRPLRWSRQLVRTEPLPPLLVEEWPPTPEAAARQARALLSPFEELWLYENRWKIIRRDIKYPSEVWTENLLDQFGLRPPQQTGMQEEWNETLWRAAKTAGKTQKEQRWKVHEMLHGVMQDVIQQLEQEAEEQKAREAQLEASLTQFQSNRASEASRASSRQHQPAWLRLLVLCIKLLGGVGTLAGVGMLVFEGRSLLSLLLDSVILLLGVGVFAFGVTLARHGKHGFN